MMIHLFRKQVLRGDHGSQTYPLSLYFQHQLYSNRFSINKEEGI